MTDVKLNVNLESVAKMGGLAHVRRQLGLLSSGRVCLVCDEPLFGPELLHARSLPGRPSNLLDAIRYAGTTDGGWI